MPAELTLQELKSSLWESANILRGSIDAADFKNYILGMLFFKRLSDVTPYDIYTGRHLEIIQKRKEAKSRTLPVRRDYNRTAREQGSGL